MPLKLGFEESLGTSPTGTVTADRGTYDINAPGTVTVTLDAASTRFPAGSSFYNVERIVLLRRTGAATVEMLAATDATDGQTTFTLAFTNGANGLMASDLLSTKPGFAQAYPGSYPASSNPPMTGATATASLGYPGGSGHTGDATYRVSLTVPHTASSFAFSVIGGVNALEATGERWGLDNVRVIVLP